MVPITAVITLTVVNLPLSNFEASPNNKNKNLIFKHNAQIIVLPYIYCPLHFVTYNHISP